MRENPKIATSSVTTLAIGAVQVGTLFLAMSEQTAFGGARLDRFLNRLVLISILWVIVAALDLLLFPTMRMTRLITGPALKTAGLVVAFQAIFQLAFAFFNDYDASLAHHAAGIGLSLIVYWALISIWSLLRESFSQRRQNSREAGDSHEAGAWLEYT